MKCEDDCGIRTIPDPFFSLPNDKEKKVVWSCETKQRPCASLSPAVPRATVFAFSVNSSSRGYHVYQSIWPNPSQDDELTDV